MKSLYQAFQLVLLVVLLSLSSSAFSEQNDEPVDFTLPQLHGEDVTLSDLRGKWVVINYWATWCAPCRKEIPELSALHDSDENIVVLGLAFEDTDEEAFDEFLKEFKPSYPILLVDVYSPPEPFGTPMALPKTIVLDPGGIPVKTFVGPVTREELEEVINL
jgi:thiol-disulfide isomerase/thioredoxin